MRRARAVSQFALFVLSVCATAAAGVAISSATRDLDVIAACPVSTTIVGEHPDASAPAFGFGLHAQASPRELPLARAFVLHQSGRKLIKQGNMTIVVADTEEAIEAIRRVVELRGGHQAGLSTETQQGYMEAAMSVSVPTEQFEAVQRGVRAVALRIIFDEATGTDRTEDYEAYRSRRAYLEDAQARLRTLLAQGMTAEQAVRANAELADVEAEQAEVQTQLAYLEQRTSYAMLRISIIPERTTPTPTPEATATPTPTPTTTPSPTPSDWRPSETLRAATRTITDVGRRVWVLLIWFAVVALPRLLLVAGVLALIVWLSRRGGSKGQAGPGAPRPAPKGGEGAGPPGA